MRPDGAGYFFRIGFIRVEQAECAKGVQVAPADFKRDTKRATAVAFSASAHTCGGGHVSENHPRMCESYQAS